MKKNVYTLTLQEHFYFLNQERKDPITGDLIKENDEIVICSSCKSAFLKESWEYMGSEHCNQSQTLRTFPSISVLKLEKCMIGNFTLPTLRKRFSAFGIDFIMCLLIIAISSSLVTLVESFLNKDIFLDSFYGLLFCCLFYIIFRDAFLLNGSSGKKYYDLYFINKKTKKRPLFFKIAIRNLLFWLPNILAISYFYFPSQVNEIDAVFSGFKIASGIFSLLVILFGNFTHFLYTLTQQQPFFDKLLGIQLVESK